MNVEVIVKDTKKEAFEMAMNLVFYNHHHGQDEKFTCIGKLYQHAIAELDLDPYRQLPPNTLTKRIKHFRENNSDLFEKTDAV